MINFYFHKLSPRNLSLFFLFLFLSALVFADMTRTSPIFKTSGIFTVVLDPGNGGCQMCG